jgi:hypothetical protein
MCRYLAGTGDARRIMGDKSPKATNKHASQKKAQASTNTKNKNNAIAAKQVVKGKK